MGEQQHEERGQTLLEEMCGADKPLYAVLSWYLYRNPLEAVSKKDLDILIEEAEKSGRFRPAIDKAIFEGTQNLEEREKHVEVLRNLTARAVRAAELALDSEKERGLDARASSLASSIEDYRFMSERAADVMAVASEYYKERLLEFEANVRREVRQAERKQSERNEQVTSQREEGERAAARRERKKMGRGERREARRQAKIENAAAKDRREARREKNSEAEAEERAIEETEQAAREARKEKRRQKR